ncbi:hypothetical protein GCM10022384_33140 [Streptomyces marokkonensis]|uniref:Transposase n=1 Tax=Streptomyces marokkonensis TaxID=324855 RepID=A0ABP7QES5_9ACTN
MEAGLAKVRHDAAAREDLVTTWPDSGGAGSRMFTKTDVHRGADLLQTRPPVEADLPAAAGRRQPGRAQELLLARLPGTCLIAAHQQLGGPIVLVRDNLNVHGAAGLGFARLSGGTGRPRRTAGGYTPDGAAEHT